MNGFDDFVDYNSGSGAGTPLADLFFSLLIARVLRFIDSELADRSLTFDAHVFSPNPLASDASNPIDLSGASYIDDSFFAVVDPSASSCLARAKPMASIVIDAFCLHGFRIIFPKERLSSCVTLQAQVPVL